MLKKGLIGLIVGASLLGSRTAAAKVDFDQGVDVQGVIEQVRGQVAADTRAEKAALANWTIMVYVNAKNNLEKFGLSDVNEMEKVGSTDKVRIAVELGRISGYDTSDGDWKGQRRYIVQKDNDASKVTSPILQEIPKADMGDWKHLVDFVNWAKEKAPAQRYMLIVWNHGSGWDKARIKNISIRGISYDDETGNHMSTPALGQALAAIGKLDIYASDACLMQMAEVVYQVRDYTDYVVGSEETEPGDGYTYDAFLGPLSAKPSMTAAEVAKLTAQAYTDHYAGINQGATQSAVQSATLPELLAHLDDWTNAIMAANETALVKSARSQAQSFDVSDNKDLLHYAQLINAGTKSSAVKSKGAALESFLTGSVIITNAATGSGYKNANGLAIYLPNYSYNSDYNELVWAQDGSWASFAKWQKDIRDDSGGGSPDNGSDGGSDDGWDYRADR